MVTNVPGPQFPLYAAGARMLASYPVIPLAKGQALSIGLTSYDGGVYYGLNADRDAMPDIDVLASLIEDARGRVATAINTELVMLYWGIGKRIRDEVLGGERARYREGVVERIAERLAARFGRGYSRRNLFRMLQFAELYPNSRIVSPLAAQLTWTNIVELLTTDEQPKRDFYMTMCAHEHWSKRTLRAKVDGKLYERTVGTTGSASEIQAHLGTLSVDGITTPALAFRDPYVLDFLGLDPRQDRKSVV